MNRALVAVGLWLALSGAAFAQQKPAKEQIVGAWTLCRSPPRWTTATGRAVRCFAKGRDHFRKRRPFLAVSVARGDCEDCANDRAKATPEKHKASSHPASAYYGTYAIDETTRVMSVNLAARPMPTSPPFPIISERLPCSLRTNSNSTTPRTPNGMDAAHHLEARGSALR